MNRKIDDTLHLSNAPKRNNQDQELVLEEPKFRSIGSVDVMQAFNPQNDGNLVGGYSKQLSTESMFNASFMNSYKPGSEQVKQNKKLNNSNIDLEQSEFLLLNDLQKFKISKNVPPTEPLFVEKYFSFVSILKDPEQILAQLYKILRSQNILKLEATVDYRTFKIQCTDTEDLDFAVNLFSTKEGTYKIEFQRQQGDMLRFCSIYRHMSSKVNNAGIVKDQVNKPAVVGFAPPKLTFA